MKRVAVESPFSGSPVTRLRNARYLSWCVRFVYDEGCAAYAGHAIGPLGYGEDPIQRAVGLEADAAMRSGCNECWQFIDLGITNGMQHKRDDSTVSWFEVELAIVAPDYWAAFQRGEWAPGTMRLIPAELADSPTALDLAMGQA